MGWELEGSIYLLRSVQEPIHKCLLLHPRVSFPLFSDSICIHKVPSRAVRPLKQHLLLLFLFAGLHTAAFIFKASCLEK